MVPGHQTVCEELNLSKPSANTKHAGKTTIQLQDHERHSECMCMHALCMCVTVRWDGGHGGTK